MVTAVSSAGAADSPAGPVVTLVYLDHCHNWPLAADRLRAAIALAGLVDVRIDWRPVHDAKSAVARGFAGSPTLLVDGVDPFPRPTRTDGLCCRFYPTGEGLSAAPSVDQLVAALRAATGQPT